jgi:hypothetical protein
MYQVMVQRGGLSDPDPDPDCCMGCAMGTGCESGLGQDPLTDFTGGVPAFLPPDQPTSAPTVEQQILEGSINFVSPSTGDSGPSILSAVAAGTNFVPGVGPIASPLVGVIGTWFRALDNWLHIGGGRSEADLITKSPYGNIQDQVFQHIKSIGDQVTGSTPVPELQAFQRQLEQLRSAWLTFLSNTTHFHDGRAPAQAANSIMPFLDGTCGYHWPPPLVPDWNTACGTDHPTPFGNAWVTDWGYGSGLLGVIKRRIVDAGGQLAPPQLTQGFTGIPGLDTPTPGRAYLPQAGYLPASGPLPTWSSTGVQPVQAGFPASSLLAIAAGLFLMKML